MSRLNVNIDHVATVREARRTIEPSLAAAAMMCEAAGADGITVHLRGDRRHIQDRDLYLLRDCVTTYLNVEMATGDEMISIALDARPDCVTLVEERPGEVTTEGGLDTVANFEAVKQAIETLRAKGIITSVFIDPEPSQIEAANKAGANQIELSTAYYAEATLGRAAFHPAGQRSTAHELTRLRTAAEHAAQLGVRVAAGHGLTTRNVGAVAAISHITEFNIGHSIIAGAIFKGLDLSVREMIDAIHRGRSTAK
ncbi:MAG: pyridoxine 5'-phosphate synthase [Pyrinomonadaceae bacterium MAG19_C2-C3]|nr:pyridoxine 5'-phosphate synthase [Pyrinomonadaceae bacterium MAG19_C2-C3]